MLELLRGREEYPEVAVAGLDAESGERYFLLGLVGGLLRLALALAGGQGLAGGQLRSLGEGRPFGLRRFRPPGEGVEGQAGAHRRVAGDEDEVAASQGPAGRRPLGFFGWERGAAGSPSRPGRRGRRASRAWRCGPGGRRCRRSSRRSGRRRWPAGRLRAAGPPPAGCAAGPRSRPGSCPRGARGLPRSCGPAPRCRPAWRRRRSRGRPAASGRPRGGRRRPATFFYGDRRDAQVDIARLSVEFCSELPSGDKCAHHVPTDDAVVPRSNRSDDPRKVCQRDKTEIVGDRCRRQYEPAQGLLSSHARSIPAASRRSAPPRS